MVLSTSSRFWYLGAESLVEDGWPVGDPCSLASLSIQEVMGRTVNTLAPGAVAIPDPDCDDEYFLSQ